MARNRRKLGIVVASVAFACLTLLGAVFTVTHRQTLQATSSPASRNVARGIFRHPASGRPLGMWMLERDTRTVHFLDASGKRVSSGRFNDDKEATVTSATGAVYLMKLRGDAQSGENIALYDYQGRFVTESEHLKD